MEKLSDQFLADCRKDQGRILRGEAMTRIDTFVDAAFAFAFTMLVISIDQIPRSPTELIELSKDIPSFVFSSLIIGSIWIAHSSWSKIFGLQDGVTVLLSLCLVVLTLIFVYPIKMINQITVEYFSQNLGWDFLLTGLFQSEGWYLELVWVIFVYLAIGLIMLSIILIAFYQNTLRFSEELSITLEEVRYCTDLSLIWGIVAATAFSSLTLASLLPPEKIQFSGYVYFSLFLTTTVVPYLNLKYRSPQA